MADPINVPVNFSPMGPVVTSPEVLRQLLIATVAALNPGYTVLPSGLIEDISSTDTAALSMFEMARQDSINQLTPYAANPYLTRQLGFQAGVPQGQQSNASVFVVFTGPPGFILAPGFLVSDGTNNYALIDGGTIGTDGTSPPLQAVATLYGVFSIPLGSVNLIITSVPSPYVITVTNPTAGTPAGDPETDAEYKSRVILAGCVGGQATPEYIQTLITKVLGVQPRLVRTRQANGGWQVFAGGSGDPYLIGGAILKGTLDLDSIKGSISDPTLNIPVSLIRVPDTYSLVYVNPKLQNVEVALSWNTTIPNFLAADQVNQLGAPAIVNYINSIIVGTPMSTVEITEAFLSAVADVLPASQVSSIVLEVRIDGVVVVLPPDVFTILGNAEGYFLTALTSVTVSKIL